MSAARQEDPPRHPHGPNPQHSTKAVTEVSRSNSYSSGVWSRSSSYSSGAPSVVFETAFDRFGRPSAVDDEADLAGFDGCSVWRSPDRPVRGGCRKSDAGGASTGARSAASSSSEKEIDLTVERERYNRQRSRAAVRDEQQATTSVSDEDHHDHTTTSPGVHRQGGSFGEPAQHYGNKPARAPRQGSSLQSCSTKATCSANPSKTQVSTSARTSLIPQFHFSDNEQSLMTEVICSQAASDCSDEDHSSAVSDEEDAASVASSGGGLGKDGVLLEQWTSIGTHLAAAAWDKASALYRQQFGDPVFRDFGDPVPTTMEETARVEQPGTGSLGANQAPTAAFGFLTSGAKNLLSSAEHYAESTVRSVTTSANNITCIPAALGGGRGVDSESSIRRSSSVVIQETTSEQISHRFRRKSDDTRNTAAIQPLLGGSRAAGEEDHARCSGDHDPRIREQEDQLDVLFRLADRLEQQALQMNAELGPPDAVLEEVGAEAVEQAGRIVTFREHIERILETDSRETLRTIAILTMVFLFLGGWVREAYWGPLWAGGGAAGRRR